MNIDIHTHFLKSKEFWGIHSVQFTQSCLTLCDFMNCSTPGFLSTTNSQSLLNLMSIASMTPSNHLILCRPLLLLPSIFPSIKIFSNEFWKYWSFSFSISPSNESSWLISFRIEWLDILAIQGTLKSLLQHHSSKKRQFFSTQFLYSSTLTSIHDYWKNCSFD